MPHFVRLFLSGNTIPMPHHPKASYWTTRGHPSSPKPTKIIQSTHSQTCLACLPGPFLPMKTTIKAPTQHFLSPLSVYSSCPGAFPCDLTWQPGLPFVGGCEYNGNFFLHNNHFCVCMSYHTCSTHIPGTIKTITHHQYWDLSF